MSLSKSYAKALFEAALEGKATSEALDLMGTHLDELSRMLQGSPDLRTVLTGPAASNQEKISIMQELARRMGVQPLLANFLTLMARKERLDIVAAVSEAYAQVRLEASGGVSGRVVSADPVEAADLAALSEAFASKLGKKVAFQTSTDPELLAGMKVTVNGVTYDGTLRSQLQRLRDRLVLNIGTAH